MKKIGLILAIVAIVVCGAGYYMYQGAQRAALAMAGKDKDVATVSRQDLAQTVVETGTIDAVKSVEVKSKAGGRLSKLHVDEGDVVTMGQLIVEIDPQETELRVRQDEAQLRGASSVVARTDIEIVQRRVTAQANLKQAEIRLSQLKTELGIQPTLTKASIVSAKTQVTTARQELERLEKTAHPNQRSATDTALREAEANFNNSQAEYNRQKELLGQGFVSPKVVENAGLSLELARVRLRQARENSDRLETQLRIEKQRAIEDLSRAQSDLDRATANSIQDVLKRKEYENAIQDLAKARTALRDVDTLRQSRIQSQSSVDQLSSVLDDSRRQLGETKIKSPLNGVVTKKLVQEGELVAALSSFSSGTPILRIEDRTTLRVKLSINEIDTARLKLGMTAKITVDALPEKTFTGTVRKIAPASTAIGQATLGSPVSTDSVVKYDVEIWLTDVDPKLRSGMSAKCTLEVQKRDKALTLPAEYVGKDEKGRFVEFPLAKGAKPGTKPERKYVKVGLQTGATVEITEGLKEGDKVQKPKFTGPERSGFMQSGPDGQ
jgi:HlyD family secretion protein